MAHRLAFSGALLASGSPRWTLGRAQPEKTASQCRFLLLLLLLALIFVACENAGTWPSPQTAVVIIVLLAKADGGRRPIGLFLTVVRI